MVQCGDPDPTDPLSSDELEAIVADLVVHREDCYEKTLIKLGLKPKSEDDDTDDDDELPTTEKDNCDDDDTPIEVEAEDGGDGDGNE